MNSVAILGASGYTGQELRRLLAHHPHVRLAHAMSAREGAEPEPPALPVDQPIERLDLAALEKVDGVFLCTPHGTAARLAQKILPLGPKVVDLSSDLRLKDLALHAKTYGHAPEAPELAQEAVYGLTEHARAAVAAARLVANPGCYPTSVLLPLKPLLRHGLLDPHAVIVADAKSGTSGAGRQPTERTHFGSVHENFLAYGVGNHRHVPEIWQEAGTERIVFVPHLLPVFRGILTTLYLTPAPGSGADAIRACLRESYAPEPFVKVYDRGYPELNRVQFTNECHIAVGTVGPQVVVISAIDNLVKGASGQALQNMNLMLGLPETAGLR
ncbi:MAG: N-acetyl-gamma-glutamyl-phosphate reductase [Planctomycetes bacterium]|nr:N-acetyl-gamma-glutamyl-phosphate reductase [Planctomycetota bacterium]